MEFEKNLNSQVISSSCNHSIIMKTHHWPYGPCSMRRSLLSASNIFLVNSSHFSHLKSPFDDNNYALATISLKLSLIIFRANWPPPMKQGVALPEWFIARFQGPGCSRYFLNNIFRHVDAYTGLFGV